MVHGGPKKGGRLISRHQEQWNTIENIREKPQEDAANFLVHVSIAVDGLAKDWKGVISQHEIKALLSEVFINGVQEEFRHVLNFLNLHVYINFTIISENSRTMQK